MIESNQVFYGMCGSQRLATRCWTSDSKNVLFSAVGPFQVSPYTVNIGKLYAEKNPQILIVL